MQSDQAPCNPSGRVEFPLSVTSCLRDQRGESSPLLGAVLSDTRLSWLSRGPLLEIVHTADGAKIASWTFGAVVRDFKTRITCVTELPHFTPPGCPISIDQVAVGLECELTGGMVCVFNIAGSRVLRAVNIPSKVTAINIVALGGESIGPLHQCFKSMNGIAAVGTNDGQILLLDLRRNDCDNALQSAHSTQWEGVRDELQSCGLISLKDVNSNLLEECPDDHLFLHLNEKYFLKHQRLGVSFPSRQEDALFPEDPSVTSLLYVPQLGSLIAGFAFGSFQIWTLQSLSLVYTLPVCDGSPLVRLSFQEACDDPNAYCYLWTVKGGLGSYESVVGDLDHPVPVYGPPSATMFSLCYDEKVWLPEYGHFYKNFMLCSTGFEFDLRGVKDTVGGRLISLYSVNRGMTGPGVVNSPSEDNSAVGPAINAISLCLIVWETWGPTGPSCSVNPVNTHMALFDINQWYVDQMPSRLSYRGGPSRNKLVASYLVSYDLESIISTSGGLLLDVRVNPTTLIQFSSVQNAEEFSRPSSLAFGSKVLMERQVIHLKHPGVQRALLTNLMSTGPGALMTPTNLFHECLVLGLRPLLMDMSNAMNVPIDEQRTFIICVALEQHLGRFINRCAREWADGRLSAAGCTLSWLLSIAWNRAAVLKQFAIRICAQLFDHSGEKLENNAQRQLHHIIGIFHLLETLFDNVVQNKWHLALNESPQVNLQNDALKLECQYYDVLQWLIDVDLLPEGLNPTVPYPAQEIAEYYHSRRLELQQQGEEENMQDLLFIDSLLKNEPGGVNVFAEWERDAGGNAGPGAGYYPPVSLQALLRTFLIKDVALPVKHSVVIYVLMDLANILVEDQYQGTLQNFMKFPAAFCMSAGTMRLTQAFWHLDHQAFDTAVDMLLDPLVTVQDIAPWQHRCIIRLLSLQGQASLALRYVRARRPPLQEQSDLRLHLNLLIANDLIDDAFMYQRNHRSEENVKSLLSQFFQGCEERNKLATTLQFSFDDAEEMAFSRYLESSKHPSADDLRVLYLLKRSRYVEALDVNQDLRKKGRSGGTRDVVVNGFYKTLPLVTRKLAGYCAQQQNKLRSWSQVEKPSPLFVNPKIASPQMRYKSSLLEAAVEKSRETWAKLVDRIPSVLSEVESTPFLCTPRTKLIVPPRSTGSTIQKIEPRGIQRKRGREDDEYVNADPGNLKRSRFQKLETALAELQQQNQQEQQKAMKERYSTYSCTDTLPLLHTPVVQRRSPSTRAKLQQEMIASSPGHSTITPQSIIKVRSASGTPKSESPKCVLIRDIANEPELTEEESESEPFPSLRKANKGESETDSESGDKDEAEGPVGVTARRIIDFDSDISSDLSVSESSFETHISPSNATPLSKQANVSSEKSLSRMVVLSEARKAGKPHTVTFGKGSICVYDQDEPVDSEVAVQDESSNDTMDQEPSRDGNLEDSEVNGQQEDEESTQECDFENSDLVEVEETLQTKKSDPKVRSFRLDTSGLGTMTASSIQVDLSHSDDGEVFHSADNSVQGTMCSPTFRKSLARPPVREITRRLSGSLTNIEDDSDTEQKETTAASSCSNRTLATHSSVDHLARLPIRSVYRSVGETLDLSNVAAPASDGVVIEVPEELEIFSAPSASVDKSADNLGSLEEETSVVVDPPYEVIPSAMEEAEDLKNFETSEIDPNMSHDSFEIVELDDDGGDSDEVGVEGNEKVIVTMEECVEEKGEAAVDDEDSVDNIVIAGNSNIFRTSHIDHVDSSSEESNFSEDKAETEDGHLSFDTDSQKSEKVYNLTESDAEENISSDNSEPHVSSEGSELNRACVVDSQTSAYACKSNVSNEHVGLHQEPVISVGHSGASITAPQDLVDRKLGRTIVQEKMAASTSQVDPGHSVEVVKGEQLAELSSPLHEKASPTELIKAEHDDMPSLRLNSSLENLCESPEHLAPSEITSSSPIIRKNSSMENSSTFTQSIVTGKDMDATLLSRSSQEGSSPSPKTLLAKDALSLTPAKDKEPATPKSSRKGRTRRTSASSTLSELPEEDVSNRRVTRSQLRSLIMEQSFESLSESESVKTTEAPQKKIIAIHKTKGKDGSRNRCNSTSSISSSCAEATETQDKTRRRRASLSSQVSVPESNSDGLPLGKLENIAEEEVSDKASESSTKTGTSKRKRKTSEVDTIPLRESSGVMETYETSRRLTRHQRALLAKSMEVSSVNTAMNSSIQPSDGEEVDLASDDDRMSLSSVRSSQRLRAKRRKGAELDSPSSTASTVINPALTPQLRRRQSASDVSELNRDASPASSVRRRGSQQPPGTPSSVLSTPTRRSARLSARQQSEDGDNQSVASASPSSVASGRTSASARRGARSRVGRPRRLSASSESSEQYAFSPPEVAHPNPHASPDADVTEAFAFSPPKTLATPSKAMSSSTDSGGSASRKTRQSRASALPAIKEESSSRVSLESSVPTPLPQEKSNKRPSWFFIQPPASSEEPQKKGLQGKQPSATKRGRHSVYSERKKFPVVPLPRDGESEEESDVSSEPGQEVKSTRQAASSQKQTK